MSRRVRQDGGDFYILSGPQKGAVYAAPFAVSDGDLAAADRARAWFESCFNTSWEYVS